MSGDPRSEPDARYTVGVVCSRGVGPERGGRERNEDNYLLCRDGRVAWRENDEEVGFAAPHGRGVLVAVADGMGGHEDGELASAAAVQAVARLYLRPPPEDPERELRVFVMEAHRRLRARVAAAGAVKMGTTLTVAWLLGNRAYFVHVGDSRLYHWRVGRLTRLTRDHTRGEFARRDSRSPPRHPTYLSQNFIYGSRGLGDDAALRVDAGIDTGSVPLLPGDRLLLCTDGVTARLEDAWIAEALANVPEPGACAVSLMERAVAGLSDDNITAVVMRVDYLPGISDPSTWQEDITLVPV